MRWVSTGPAVLIGPGADESSVLLGLGDWARRDEAMVVVARVPLYSAMAELWQMPESYRDIFAGGGAVVIVVFEEVVVLLRSFNIQRHFSTLKVGRGGVF